MHPARIVLEIIAAALAAGACGYYVLCLVAARDFRRHHQRPSGAGFTPAVSILKPLRGADPGIYEAFRSYCLQDYPEYEIIFGVSDANDPVIAEVERLRNEFPHRPMMLVRCPEALGANLKISTLAQMLPHARHDYVLVNDSDIHVPTDYLRRVMEPLGNSGTGLVTALYRGIAASTLGSRLEALGIATDFAPGVLAARKLEGMHFALGSTLAMPRQALEAMGGFTVLLDYLADDFELGARISRAGFAVELSEVVVDHNLPRYSLGRFLRHQLRWARAIRDARRWGYFGTAVTFGLPWALAALVLAQGAMWSWVLLAIAALLRYAAGVAVGVGVLHDRSVLRNLWLIPLRDVAGLGIWVASYAGHKINWRGQQYILRSGKLTKA